jgi:hypothetical protein
MVLQDQVKEDLWRWIREFITVPNAFYHHKFAPCPYAKSAVADGQVDVVVWNGENPRDFIRAQALGMRAERPATGLTTRVMGFPPRVRLSWGIIDYIDGLNLELVADDIFLNPGVTKTVASRFPGSREEPYFIVVANTLDPVLKGARALQRTAFYKDWPAEQYHTVVERRARLAAQRGCPAHKDSVDAAAVDGSE